MPLSRKKYKILEIVVILVFWGFSIYGFYDSYRRTVAIPELRQLTYITDFVKRVRIMEDRTEIVLADTPSDTLFLQYFADDARKLFRNHITSFKKTDLLTVGVVQERKVGNRLEIITLQINEQVIISYQDYCKLKKREIRYGPLFAGIVFLGFAVITTFLISISPKMSPNRFPKGAKNGDELKSC